MSQRDSEVENGISMSEHHADQYVEGLEQEISRLKARIDELEALIGRVFWMLEDEKDPVESEDYVAMSLIACGNKTWRSKNTNLRQHCAKALKATEGWPDWKLAALAPTCGGNYEHLPGDDGETSAEPTDEQVAKWYNEWLDTLEVQANFNDYPAFAAGVRAAVSTRGCTQNPRDHGDSENG